MGTELTQTVGNHEAPRVLSHRGGRCEYDDNAAGGFRKSLEAGITGFETDVHMTADRKLIIMHDENAKRTTGFDGIVEEMSFADVTALTLLASGEKVPSLDDLLAVLGGHEGIDVEFEMKTDSPFYRGEHGDLYCRLLHEAVVAAMAPGTYVFSSFVADTLGKMKRLYPDAPTGLIVGTGLTHENIALAHSLGCCRIAPVMKGCTRELVDEAHAAGLKVTGWMVQELETWKAARAMGMDNTTSDYPLSLIRAVREASAAQA